MAGPTPEGGAVADVDLVAVSKEIDRFDQQLVFWWVDVEQWPQAASLILPLGPGNATRNAKNLLGVCLRGLNLSAHDSLAGG